MSEQVIIKVAGHYTVTTDGDRIYINGRQSCPQAVHNQPHLACILDTGCIGKNGKRDLVGLTPDQYSVHTAQVARRKEADLAAYSSSAAGMHAELIRRLSSALDQVFIARHHAVEGAARDGVVIMPESLDHEVKSARHALDDFEAAHPHLIAAIKANRAAKHEAAQNAVRWA